MRAAFREPAVAALALGFAVVVLIFGLRACSAPDPRPHPPSVRTADSLARTRPAAERVDSARADTARAAVARVARRTPSTQRHTDDAAAFARMAAAAQTARDSATYWQLAYVEQRSRADSLAADTVDLGAALRAEHARAIDNLARRTVAEDALTDLRADYARAAAGCRVPGTFGRLRCPTRKEAFVAGSVTTLVAGAVLVAHVRGL